MPESIWLEVANVRLENSVVQIQVKGDRTDREPVWWDVELENNNAKPESNDAYRTIVDGLDKKRVVLAKLAAEGNTLKCAFIRVQYAESNSR